jgi:hypothetical protein
MTGHVDKLMPSRKEVKMIEEDITQQIDEDELDLEEAIGEQEDTSQELDEDECGCDVEINDEDATLDEDLPAAEGGVA